MDREKFFSEMSPKIDAAARGAQRRAKTVIADVHMLWMVYMTQRNALMFEAARVFDGEGLSRSEFEERLLELAGESEETVWVDNGLDT